MEGWNAFEQVDRRDLIDSIQNFINLNSEHIETSDDFKVGEKKTEAPKDIIIEDLKITVRKLTKEDIKIRKRP